MHCILHVWVDCHNVNWFGTVLGVENQMIIMMKCEISTSPHWHQVNNLNNSPPIPPVHMNGNVISVRNVALLEVGDQTVWNVFCHVNTLLKNYSSAYSTQLGLSRTNQHHNIIWTHWIVYFCWKSKWQKLKMWHGDHLDTLHVVQSRGGMREMAWIKLYCSSQVVLVVYWGVVMGMGGDVVVMCEVWCCCWEGCIVHHIKYPCGVDSGVLIQ